MTFYCYVSAVVWLLFAYLWSKGGKGELDLIAGFAASMGVWALVAALNAPKPGL